MLLLFMFSFIIGISHIEKSLRNCKLTMLWTIQSYGKIYFKMSLLKYISIFIDKSFNSQNLTYVKIFALNYLCYLFVSFAYSIIILSVVILLYSKLVQLLICLLVTLFLFIDTYAIKFCPFQYSLSQKKIRYRLQKMCTNNTILPLCNNNVIALTFNYVMLLFQYNIIYLHIALNVKVMIIIRHIPYLT